MIGATWRCRADRFPPPANSGLTQVKRCGVRRGDEFAVRLI